jgi:arginine exporter protein ArgO
MSDVEKFMFLLTSYDLDICKVVILGVSNMYLVNQSMNKSSVLLVISDNDFFQYLNYNYLHEFL